jgi:hypothetical protein
MAMIELKTDPSSRDLKWFGVGLGVLALITGAHAWWRGGETMLSWALPAFLALLTLVYGSVRPLRRLIFRGWMYAVFPIGWAVSHALLAGVYYGILTPIGLAMRAGGHDPLGRKFEPERRSYWVEHDPGRDRTRYFKQF